MLLICAQRDKDVTREEEGAVRAAEPWEESDSVEEVEEVGDTERDDITTSGCRKASCVRCMWLSSVLRAVSMSRG